MTPLRGPNQAHTALLQVAAALFLRAGPAALALVLPFVHARVRFRSKTGLDLDVPPSAWHQLPNMCRLAQIGARCSFEADCKRIELDGYTFFRRSRLE